MQTTQGTVLQSLRAVQSFLNAHDDCLGAVNKTGARQKLDDIVVELSTHVATQAGSVLSVICRCGEGGSPTDTRGQRLQDAGGEADGGEARRRRVRHGAGRKIVHVLDAFVKTELVGDPNFARREAPLDGMLFANALHFIPHADEALTRLTAWVKPGGRVVFVEYDRRAASRWMPYPIPASSLPALAAAAGLSAPTITATRPSE